MHRSRQPPAAAAGRRVGIVAILQESNTFLRARTTLDDFRRDLFVTGAGMREALAAAHHEVGGFFAGLAAAGLEAVPLLAARALPGGMLTADAVAALLAALDAALAAAGPLDGLLVAPHGATVSETAADFDGHWLGRLRRAVGPIPIIGTIDPHANLSPAMIAATDALVAYRTNPHVDQRDRGMEAAALMAGTLSGRLRPTQAAAFPPLAINIECQNPAALPCLPHYEAAAGLREPFAALPAAAPVPPGCVLSTSIVLGFPYADVAELGSAAIVVTHDDAAAAARHADALGAGLWAARDTFLPELLDADQALDRAATLPGPVCLLDMGDNVGGGSPADGTTLAHALIRRGIPRGFICVCDPEAAGRAVAAGRGATFAAAVGGRSPEWAGIAAAGPIGGRWRVAALSDGRFTESQPRHGGAGSFNQGPTAVLVHESGLTVMTSTARMAPFSLGQIRHAGLDPASFTHLVAKGVHAPVAAYREVCPSFVRVDTPGVTAASLDRLTYRHRRRPLHPFEREPCDHPTCDR
jgi:microcystin degradation protein MlrC